MKTGRMHLARKHKGFTLIEIAIVLVIIGLLLGGVLQGQQLIENSRVKQAVNSFNGIAAATFSYQDRYGRLPGDDPGATTRGAAWPTGAAPAARGTGRLGAMYGLIGRMKAVSGQRDALLAILLGSTQQMPGFTRLEPDHRVACWLYGEGDGETHGKAA